MKKLYTPLVFVLIFSLSDAFSQSVSINTDGSNADASSILDVKATDKGVLIPRVSLTDVASASPVSSPASGLLVYNTNATVTGGHGVGFYVWNGTSWIKLVQDNDGAFIRNQNTTDQTANFRITGIGRANTSFQSPIYTRADAGTVAIRPHTDATNAIQLQNATGTPILNVDATNSRVGIGTVTPTNPLSLESTSSGTNFLLSLRTNSSATGIGVGIKFTNTNGTNMDLGSGEIVAIRNLTGGNADFSFRLANNTPTMSERFTITGIDGFVGINSHNAAAAAFAPTTALHIRDRNTSNNEQVSIEKFSNTVGQYTGIRFRVSSNTPVNENYKGAIYFERTETAGRGSLHFATNDANVNATNVSPSDIRMTITRSGNVGIGTTNPNHTLMVQSSAGPQLRIHNPTNAPGSIAGIRFNTGSGWDVQLRTNQNNSWLELTNSLGDVTHRWNGFNYHPGNSSAFITTGASNNNISIQNGSLGIATNNPAESIHTTGNIRADGIVYWGNSLTRTETRDDAGLQGNAGARSGFFETSAPSPAANWYPGATGWQHLIDIRHNNPNNNFAMQFAGSFFDQNLWYRKTNNNPAQAWSRILTSNDINGTTNYVSKFTSANTLGNSQIFDNGTNVGIGITTPSQKLDVQGGNARINNTFIGDVGHGVTWGGFSHSSQNTTTGYALLQSSDGAFTLLNKLNTNSGHIGFRVSNTDVAVITNAGNMGIGTTAPAERIHTTGNIRAEGIVYWGNLLTRTETRDDAGLQGNDGARSGFFETSAPSPAANWYPGATGWQHLIDVRHSNPNNNYAMQFAGSFFDQNLWYRKTNNNPAQAWSRIITSNDINGTTNYVSKFTSANTLGNSQIFDNGTNVGIGTNNPSEKLTVDGNAYFSGASVSQGFSIMEIDIAQNTTLNGPDNAYHTIVCPDGFAMINLAIYATDKLDGGEMCNCVKVSDLITNTHTWRGRSGLPSAPNTFNNTFDIGDDIQVHSCSCNPGEIATGFEVYSTSHLDGGMKIRCTTLKPGYILANNNTQAVNFHIVRGIMSAMSAPWNTATSGDYIYHTSHCPPGTFVTGIAIRATDRLDGEMRCYCSGIKR